MRLNHPASPDTNPVDNFLASVNDLFEHALQDVGEADMVAIAIHNEVNQNDKPIGICFRHRDQFSVEAVWNVFEVTHSNSRFNSLDTLTVVLNSVRMLGGFGGIKIKGRLLSVMAHLKKRIVQVKTVSNCLAHALIIAIAKITNDHITMHTAGCGKYTPKSIIYLRRLVSTLTMVGEFPNSKISGLFSTI